MVLNPGSGSAIDYAPGQARLAQPPHAVQQEAGLLAPSQEAQRLLQLTASADEDRCVGHLQPLALLDRQQVFRASVRRDQRPLRVARPP